MAEDAPQPRGTCCPGDVNELFYGSVTVGERGQIVVPAEARKHYGLSPGDKLLVFRHPHIPGIVLARLDDLQMLLSELQQWVHLVSRVQLEHEVPARAAGRRSNRGKQIG